MQPALVLGASAVGPQEGANLAIEDQIVNVNEYDLVAGADEFVAAIEALAQKTDAEGESGVLRYQFYVNRDEGSALATIATAMRTHGSNTIDLRTRGPRWPSCRRRSNSAG